MESCEFSLRLAMVWIDGEDHLAHGDGLQHQTRFRIGLGRKESEFQPLIWVLQMPMAIRGAARPLAISFVEPAQFFINGDRPIVLRGAHEFAGFFPKPFHSCFDSFRRGHFRILGLFLPLPRLSSRKCTKLLSDAANRLHWIKVPLGSAVALGPSPVYSPKAMADLNQLDRVLTSILEESWEIFWKDVLVYLLAAVLCAVLVTLSLGLLSGSLAVGFALLVQRRRSGEDVGASTVLVGLSHFFGATVASIVIALCVTLGLSLLLLPGLFLMAAWSMTFQAMALEALGVGAALSRSYEVFKENSLLIVSLLIVLGLLNTLSSLLLLTALLSVPYSGVALTVAYSRLANKSAAPNPAEPLKPYSVERLPFSN